MVNTIDEKIEIELKNLAERNKRIESIHRGRISGHLAYFIFIENYKPDIVKADAHLAGKFIHIFMNVAGVYWYDKPNTTKEKKFAENKGYLEECIYQKN